MAKATDKVEQEEREGSGRRLVLKRERAIVLGPGLTAEVEKELLDLVRSNAGGKKTDHDLKEVWLPVGEFEGTSMTRAIEAYAGKPGTPDAKIGAYKAPPVRSWAGGEIYEAPPVPLVQRKALD